MYNEVDDVLGSKSEISSEDASKLEYIGQVWKETLRLYPVAPYIIRCNKYGNFKIDGHFIPKGTTIAVCEKNINKHPYSMISWI